MFRGQDSGYVVNITLVVQDAVLRDGNIISVPHTGEVESRDHDPYEEDDADSSVGVCVPWADQRAVVERIDLSPVESEASEREAKGNTGLLSEKLVDDDVVWLDPCDPSKETRGRGAKSVFVSHAVDGTRT